MSLADRLFEKARHYETLAASCGERAPIEPPERRLEFGTSAVAFTVTAIILRELAALLDGEDGW
jgi:hypothetical protein